jgi:hypothetical protein
VQSNSESVALGSARRVTAKELFDLAVLALWCENEHAFGQFQAGRGVGVAGTGGLRLSGAKYVGKVGEDHRAEPRTRKGKAHFFIVVSTQHVTNAVAGLRQPGVPGKRYGARVEQVRGAMARLTY